ncbi:MAG: LysR family transcriptional regulator [Pseudomonadota bacterium]
MHSFDLFRLDGHTLRVFASVCETGSVSRTAQLFELNQSTISHTLDKMRAAVGDPLFVKSGRGITPSEKALAILPRVQKILADIEGLVAPESYDVSRDSKPVVLAIPTPALLHEMKALHEALLAAEPNIEFEIRRLAPRERVTQMLSEDEADLAISVAGIRYPSVLNHCHYSTDSLAVFYDPDHRGPITTSEDYANARHGTVNFGGDTKSVAARALLELGLRRRVSVVAPTASMLGDLIKGTDIVATMPSRLAFTAYQGLAWCKPPFVLPALEYHLVWHRRYEHSGRNTWLRQQVLAARKAGPRIAETVANKA